MALLPVEDALALLLEGVAPCPPETLGLHEAAGRVLARDLAALRKQPPFDVSAMDGYAVRAEDIAGIPVRLRVVGTSPAGGDYPHAIQPGEAVRIFTGAPVPQGADTILLQEDAEPLDGGMVEAREATALGRHIRRAGLDFEIGEHLLDQGRVLDPAALSLAAAANHALLPVTGKPLVAIIATGDELVLPGTTPGPNQIVASNAYGIAAIVRDAGGVAHDLGIVGDDRAAMGAKMDEALGLGARIVVTLGGASVGDHDLVREVLTGKGMELDFWKIAMRPGKPLMSGRFGETRVLGLPGNPVSSMVCAYLFLAPLVACMAGRQHQPNMHDAVLGASMRANDQRQDYVRASVDSADGVLVATPFDLQDSSMLKTLAAANALIVRAPGALAADRGDPCRVMMLR